MDDLAHRAWVLTEGGRGGTTSSFSTIPVVRQMELLGIAPRIAASADSFLAVPLLVVGTDRLAVVQRRLVASTLGLARLRILPLPFTPVPLVEAAWWHPVHKRDAGHRWFASLPGPGRPRVWPPRGRATVTSPWWVRGEGPA